jgi:DNA-binding Xre family transcriptional regulator
MNSQSCNSLLNYLQEKDIQSLRPSGDLLSKLDIKIHTWNKWMERKSDPELWQLVEIARFLGCAPADLIEFEMEEPILQRHALR